MSIDPQHLSEEAELRFDSLRQEELIARLRSSQVDLERLNAELQRSNGELEWFAYVASHDLSEPLRAVSSFARRLADKYEGQLDADADDYLAFILDGTERMRELIQALMTYSRVGRGELHAEWVDTQALVEATLVSLGVGIDDPRVEVAPGLPGVRADRALLGQVFQNLIANALKFTGGSEARVRVAAQRHGPEWLYSVADQGIGIEARYAERVFEVFERLHARDVYEGAGIGLAVCRRVIERHGGLIWVQPDTPVGTTICFTLPHVAGP